MGYISIYFFAFECFLKEFGDATEILFSSLTLNMGDVTHDYFGFNITS